ncbi:restriction endonuclease subunit S [Salmonella enterica]|nr:restriction endonuclease subunit S [Salmonella enterica]
MVNLMVSEQQSGASEKGVPAGFKLTEVGVIPEDWECVPFGNLFKTSIKKKSVSDHELVSFIGMQDVSEDAQLKNSIQLPFKEVKSGFTYFEKGDVLLAKITPCFENGKGCHTAELPTNIGFGSTEFHVLRENEDSDSRFIYFWTTDIKFRASLESEMVGSAGHRRVPLVAIKTFLIPCPKNKQEQSAIANTLSDIDDLIIASEKLIAKKQAIKTATMQQLLTGKTRLPQFALRDDGTVKGYKKSELGELSEDWIVSTFGSVMKIRHGKNQKHVECFDGEYPIYATGGQIGKANAFLYNKPSVLIGRKGTIDKPRYTDKPFWTVDTLFYSEISESADAQFIYYQFCMIDWMQYNEASGVPSLNAGTIESIQTMLPSIEEQTAIAAILSDMDKDIQTLQQRLDKTRQLKQGMMQELLTGKTRLI